MKYDVGIVGAGIAGLSTALHVCRNLNVSLLLIDRGKIGDPTKTSPFTFYDTVEKYQLTDAVIQSYTRFTYRSPSGVSATFEYCEPVFVTLDYEKACEILLRRIEREGSVEILQNAKVVRFEHISKDHLIIWLSDDRKMVVEVLVDASGKSFLAAKTLGLRLPSYYSHAYGEVLGRCEIEDPSEMHILAGRKYGNGGGWFYPIDKMTARYGFATVTKSVEYPSAIVKANFRRACESFHPYSEFVKNAERRRSEFGTIPVGPLRRFVLDNVLIVGDSAGQATPWYCEGIRPALESGTMCGKTIVKAFKDKSELKERLKEYETEWNTSHRDSYSIATKRSLFQWFRSQEDWDRGVEETRLLSPEEMIARVRYGWQRCGNRRLEHLVSLVGSILFKAKYSIKNRWSEPR